VTSQNKNGRDSWGTFATFVWTTMGRKFSSDHISAKKPLTNEDVKGMRKSDFWTISKTTPNWCSFTYVTTIPVG